MNVNHVPKNGSVMHLTLVDSSNSACMKGEEKGPRPHSFLIHATSLTPHMIIIILTVSLPCPQSWSVYRMAVPFKIRSSMYAASEVSLQE